MELIGDVTLRRIETVDTQTGEVKVSLAYSAPVRVTVAGALPRTDVGFHPVTEETSEGHDTAIKGSVTDGMKRAFRSFGPQFGNSLYGDQSSANAPAQPQRVPVQAKRQVRTEPAQLPRSAGSERAQRRPGGHPAKAPHGTVCQTGVRRGAGTDRRPAAEGEGHRRPDGGRDRELIEAAAKRLQERQAQEA